MGVNISTMTLTDRQQAVLDYLRSYTAQKGCPPTLWEIAEAFGLASPNGVAKHLRALAEKGFVALEPGRARGIRLLRPNPQADGIVLPILGQVAAGAPMGAAGELGEDLLVDARLFRRPPDYLLRVKGHSMRDDGIFDGDLVAVQRVDTAQTGATVVARLGEEITIKRLKRTARGFVLLPRNPDFAPIEVPKDADFAIEGIYCGLIRGE